MPVSDVHADYAKNISKVNQVRDCVEGSDAVKTRRGDTESNWTLPGTKYLPPSNPDDKSSENEAIYKSYRLRANYVNFTGHTKDGMLGMVFRKDTVYSLPDSIQYLEENANGGGYSLDQLLMEITGDVLEAGRYGVLVDYPNAEAGITKAKVQAQGLSARLLSYPFESIINWRTEIIGSEKKSVLIVLKECIEEINEDGFGSESVDQFRVLRLVDNTYTVEIWDKNNDKVEEYTPRKSDGSTWSYIPFVFFGSENNDESIDKAPLYDISNINLSHYRNSADFEESSYYVGQPTPVVSGLSQGWADEILKDGLIFGSKRAILLPIDAKAELLQADPNQMPMEGMRDKEIQMVKVGARIIEDSTGTETAEAARIRHGGQNSKLSVLVTNVESGMMQALSWASEFMGGEMESEIEINREFYDKSLDAQQVMALIQLSDRGDIDREDLRATLRSAGWINKEDEDIDPEAGSFDLAPVEGIEGEVMPSEGVAESPALMAILERMTANNDSGQVMAPQAPNITIEAPVFNIEVPEGFISLPENMVNVTVEAPAITVEAADISSPVNVVNGATDKEIKLVYEDGIATGAEVRSMNKEG